MAKGNLPHLSYIFRKLEPLDTEFKTVACSVTGALLFIEFHRGKEGMKHIKYHQELGATADCTKRLMGATKGIGQKSIEGGTKDFPFLIVGLHPRWRRAKMLFDGFNTACKNISSNFLKVGMSRWSSILF